jgi:pyocin large subunit-like protein
MSWKALAWASDQKCEKAADKLILLALAERHNTESRVAYPSTAWLVEFSSLDRKTVLKSLERLQEQGLIIDSSIRMGSTGGVKAWRLAYDGEAVPKTGQLKRSQNSHEAVPFFPEAVPKTGQLSGPKNGIRNRDIRTGMNRDITGDAREQKKRSALPKNFKPELTGKAAEIAAGWHSSRLAHELDAFRNYHLAKGSLMADWQAAFRTWIGNAEKWSKSNGNGNRDNRGSGNGLLDATLDEMRERGQFVR